MEIIEIESTINAMRTFGSGGFGKIRDGMIKVAFNDNEFYTVVAIVGAVLLTDSVIALVRKYRKVKTPVGSTFLQNEGIL